MKNNHKINEKNHLSGRFSKDSHSSNKPEILLTFLIFHFEIFGSFNKSEHLQNNKERSFVLLIS